MRLPEPFSDDEGSEEPNSNTELTRSEANSVPRSLRSFRIRLKRCSQGKSVTCMLQYVSVCCCSYVSGGCFATCISMEYDEL